MLKTPQRKNVSCYHTFKQNSSGRSLREERRLRVFENRVLRRIFGPKRNEVTGSGENYMMKSLMMCTPNSILFGSSNREE